jgi:saccharopine dehydrogenase (NAD+, L-lysine-forming)
VRRAADRFEDLRFAAVSTVIKDPEIALGSALDVLRQVSTAASVYADGTWHEVSIMKTRQFDFGEPFGLQRCFPVDLIELRELPEQLGLEQLGAYGAGVNPIVDLLAMTFGLAKLGRVEGAVQLGARLLVRASRRFTKPPFGVQIKLEAEGAVDGAASRLDVLLSHEDGYELTAIPLVACVLQLLDHSIRRPGLHYMGSAVAPLRFFDDMRRLGMRVSGLD